MQQEVEVKFLDVDHDDMRRKLTELGAQLEHPNRLMHRSMLDFPDHRLEKQHARLRVRDEGNALTVTFKSPSATRYSNEIETTVGSYDTTVQLFEAIGLHVYATQESRRETWHYKGIEVVLDEWPWLRPYIEIEGLDETAIKRVANELGFAWEHAAYGSVDTVYRHQYPGMTNDESIGAVAELSFAGELPGWLKDRM